MMMLMSGSRKSNPRYRAVRCALLIFETNFQFKEYIPSVIATFFLIAPMPVTVPTSFDS